MSGDAIKKPGTADCERLPENVRALTARHDPGSILVVLMGSMGDVVRGFCILRPLKEAFPLCRVTWMIESKWADLACMQPDIDDLIVFRREQGLSGALEALKSLRTGHFDITLDLQRHFKSGICSLASGSARRVGFHRNDSKEGNFLFNNEQIPRCPRDYPKVYHYLKFVEHLGVSYSEPLDFGFSGFAADEALPGALRSLDDGYFVLVMGSSKKEKDWTSAGYLGLARRLLEEQHGAVVLAGDKSQTSVSAAIENELSSPRVVNLTGATGLTVLTAVLKKARAALGPDSGPGHLSAAVGTPYIALFGPTCLPRVVPYGCSSYAVQAASGRVVDITIEEVWLKLRPLL